MGASHQTGPGREDPSDAHIVARLARSMDVAESSHPVQRTEDARRSVGTLLAVADSPGAPHERGAARIVLDGLARRLVDVMPCPDHGDRRLSDAFLGSLGEVEELLVGSGPSSRPSTSVGLAYVSWPRAFLLHAGRTHVWHVRGGRARRMLRPATDARHDDDGLLRGQLDLAPGDALVLATHLVGERLRSLDVARALRTQSDATGTSERLAHLARVRGGDGDLTVVVARFGALPASAEPDPALRALETQVVKPRGTRRRLTAVTGHPERVVPARAPGLVPEPGREREPERGPVRTPVREQSRAWVL